MQHLGGVDLEEMGGEGEEEGIQVRAATQGEGWREQHNKKELEHKHWGPWTSSDSLPTPSLTTLSLACALVLVSFHMHVWRCRAERGVYLHVLCWPFI